MLFVEHGSFKSCMRYALSAPYRFVLLLDFPSVRNAWIIKCTMVLRQTSSECPAARTSGKPTRYLCVVRSGGHSWKIGIRVVKLSAAFAHRRILTWLSHEKPQHRAEEICVVN